MKTIESTTGTSFAANADETCNENISTGKTKHNFISFETIISSFNGWTEKEYLTQRRSDYNCFVGLEKFYFTKNRGEKVDKDKIFIAFFYQFTPRDAFG